MLKDLPLSCPNWRTDNGVSIFEHIDHVVARVRQMRNVPDICRRNVVRTGLIPTGPNLYDDAQHLGVASSQIILLNLGRLFIVPGLVSIRGA
jgi:hypothetical protein